MQTTRVVLPAMHLIGITQRTNNTQEMNPATAKIGQTVQHYWNAHLADRIPARLTPGTTYCVYTDYESDYTGDYTYFIGELVNAYHHIPEGLTAITIPPQTYTKFTTDEGPMPDVCINAWMDIWQAEEAALGGKRGYLADFEVYDARAAHAEKTVLDIFIGIRA